MEIIDHEVEAAHAALNVFDLGGHGKFTLIRCSSRPVAR